MKDFKDFLSTLSEDDFASIADSSKEPLKNIQETSSPENRLGNSVNVISVFTSLALIERYHEWLHK